MSQRRRSAALNTLEELAALPELCADSFGAAAQATQALVPLDGVALNLVTADADLASFVGDAMFNGALFQRFAASYYDTEAEEVLGGSCRTLIAQGVKVSSTTAESAWLESEMYRDLFRPFGVGHLTRIFLRRGSTPVGVMVVGRAVAGRPLSTREHDDLVGVVPLLERIAASLHDAQPATADQLADEAIWVASRLGEVELASPNAESMAAMAFGMEGPLPSMRAEVASWLRHLFRQLGSQLETRAEAVVERRNGFGLFQFRAGWLQRGATSSSRTGLLSIRLARYVPLKARLFQSRSFCGLPRREKQAVLALADGASTLEIGQRLGVAPSTVLTWIRSLYLRFGVNRRGDLIGLLLGEAATSYRPSATLGSGASARAPIAAS